MVQQLHEVFKAFSGALSSRQIASTVLIGLVHAAFPFRSSRPVQQRSRCSQGCEASKSVEYHPFRLEVLEAFTLCLRIQLDEANRTLELL